MIKRIRKVVTLGAVTALLSSGAVVAAAPQASATSAYGCPWPYVCFYKTDADWYANHPTSMYRDMGYWQHLGANARGATYVYNSRNDDGALFRDTWGWYLCVGPNDIARLAPYVVTDIVITDSPTCW